MIGLIDIGGTKLLASVAPRGGTHGPALRRATPRENPIATLIDMLDEVRDGRSLSAIAMAVPGPFDRGGRRLVDPRNLSSAWWDLDLGQGLGEHFDCPVVVENDANCAALAEARHGAGRGHRCVVYFTISTGIGIGTVRDSQLVINRHDTEGGHMVVWPRWLDGPKCQCGAYGCLETLVSGPAIARRFGKPASQLEDPAAWDEVGRWLGLAVANTVSVIDPDAVVFGGGVCHQWSRFEAALHQTVAESLLLQPVPPVVLGSLGDDRNLVGALSLVDTVAG